jgi:hypothetical protein
MYTCASYTCEAKVVLPLEILPRALQGRASLCGRSPRTPVAEMRRRGAHERAHSVQVHSKGLCLGRGNAQARSFVVDHRRKATVGPTRICSEAAHSYGLQVACFEMFEVLMHLVRGPQPTCPKYVRIPCARTAPTYPWNATRSRAQDRGARPGARWYCTRWSLVVGPGQVMSRVSPASTAAVPLSSAQWPAGPLIIPQEPSPSPGFEIEVSLSLSGSQAIPSHH